MEVSQRCTNLRLILPSWRQDEGEGRESGTAVEEETFFLLSLDGMMQLQDPLPPASRSVGIFSYFENVLDLRSI